LGTQGSSDPTTNKVATVDKILIKLKGSPTNLTEMVGTSGNANSTTSTSDN